MAPLPVATYRIQLCPDFGFSAAAEVVAYLADLGISHLYTSPYLQSATGSTHGYDVVDPSRVSEELGGTEGHADVCDTLAAAGLGQMIDIVPNHMAIAGRQNPWWWDVLENGPSSRYATYFDVDWAASEERWLNKVLLPVLGDHYGRILENGEFQLSHEKESFTLRYRDHLFPVDPSSLPELLNRAAESQGSDFLAFLAESHARLPRPTVTARAAVERRHRDKAVLQDLLANLCRAEPGVRSAIDAEVARVNGDPDAMDALIEQQNYRLALWRTASRDVGYRRFFDVKDLAALRVEDIEVFRDAHALPFNWVKRGWVQGLRIDHPDGLRDPEQYFKRLREACPEAWIVAEKILEPGEALPPQWPIAGTTGYDFLNLVGGLFVDPEGEDALTRTYEEFIGEETNYQALVRACKRQVLDDLLGSELNRLTSLFVDICERHRRHRDYTRYELREALCETAVCFPVYRSYVSNSKSGAREEDCHYTGEAVRNAMARRSDLDPELFSFLQELLLLRIGGPLETELAMRFQQLTGPVMAKGVEDTAFYRFNRLLALNEVGGDPSRFGVTIEQFHQACIATQTTHPYTLLGSSTHDTKRSEDVRSRLALLSEIPDVWARAVRRWRMRNEGHRIGEWPDRNTEYLLYQTLIGAWPIDRQRLTSYAEKAVREAKLHTSWTDQNETYERILLGFIHAIMEDRVFCEDVANFVGSLIDAGRINSLAQTLIKLTAPGVPDIYQGTELWNLSLVDPDNRRQVDFTVRQRLLDELACLSPEDILARSDEGLPKLWLIRQTLHLRRDRPEFLRPGAGYRPVCARGAKAGHVVAFMRGENVISVAPRLVLRLEGEWGDTALDLPAGRWTNFLTGDSWETDRGRLADILARFPVAILLKEE